MSLSFLVHLGADARNCHALLLARAELLWDIRVLPYGSDAVSRIVESFFASSAVFT